MEFIQRLIFHTFAYRKSKLMKDLTDTIFTKFTLFLFAVFVANVSFGQLTNGLQGYWTFDGNADDQSGNNNHGTVYGASLSDDRYGSPNKSYCFDGVNDYIETLFAGVSGSTSRTVSFWAKVSSSGNTISTAGIEFFTYGDAPGTAPGGSFRLVLNRNCQGIGVNIGSSVRIVANSLPSYDVWHHYAVVYDENVSSQLNSIVLYLDGNMVSNINCETYYINTSLNTQTIKPINFGRLYITNIERFFTGCLDDFRIYDRALSNNEIDSLYHFNELGVKEEYIETQVKIFPNPTNDILNIESESNEIELIELLSLEGTKVFESGFVNMIDISLLKPGMYIVRLLDKKKNILNIVKFTKL